MNNSTWFLFVSGILLGLLGIWGVFFGPDPAGGLAVFALGSANLAHARLTHVERML